MVPITERKGIDHDQDYTVEQLLQTDDASL